MSAFRDDKYTTNNMDIYNMPSVLVTRSSLPPFEEYIEEIKEIWETHWLTNMGPKHQKLQAELGRYLDVQGIDLLTNGHMALELTIQALELKGEVITTPFTFASTTHAIVRNGLKPVFCDINEYDYTIDASKIESLITNKTCAILPVHVYGNICDVSEIERIAQKYNLKVIYDAAHSFGEEYDGIGVGNFGDASCFSFHATKVFNTIEGGAVCYADKKFGKDIAYLKNFGIRDAENVDGVGANAKMNEFCAAMGLCNLRHIEEEIDKRRLIFERYRERLSGVPGIQLSRINPLVKYNYAYFPIVVDEIQHGCGRDEILYNLEKNGIGARKYFYPITSEFNCFKNVFDSRKTPIALEISKRVLTLPIYADLTIEIVDKICDIIENGNSNK